MGTTSLPAATWKCPQCGEEGTSFLPDESCSCDYYPDGASLTPEGWKATLRAQQFLRERSERIAELLDYGKESFDYTYADREDGTITAHWETCCARGCCSPKGHTADFPSRYIWMTDADILVEEKLKKVEARFDELQSLLAHPGAGGGERFAGLSKEYAALTPVVEAIRDLDRARQELEELEALSKDAGSDPEMRSMADAERVALKTRLPEVERKLQLLLLPKDEADQKNAILEVRAGTGGEEAALFAAVLFRMYQRYAESHGWRFEAISLNETGLGGYKEAIATITGRSVFARLKFESGVHRVQRVPETEGSGRIHTSAATVAVLPEAEEVDIQIEDKDLRIDVYRASGAGGQHVNKTESAVRITHLPTGLVVAQQDEKSQHKNRAKAMTILRSRLYEQKRRSLDAERAASRKSQVGSGDRSERIRTYNFPQGRVTDHRIGLTLHKLDQVVDGDLDDIIEALTAEDQAARLAEIA